MKYVSKKEFDAVEFDGTYESLVTVLKTFPDATFRVEMDDGNIDLSIKQRPSKADYAYIKAGDYVIFEGFQYTVYEAGAFMKHYGTSPSELAEQEIKTADHHFKRYDKGMDLNGPDWMPYNELRRNVGDDGTKWDEPPLFVEDKMVIRGTHNKWTPDLPTEEQF